MVQFNSQPQRMIELDFVRGIAILMVLNHHYNNDWAGQLGITPFGSFGVNLFFVLSGFLVGGLLIKEWRKTGKIDGFRFLKRRAFKIWPAYYFYILFAVVIHSHPYNTFLVGNLLNIQNYTGTSLGHTWSLAVEEHFYLLLAAFMTFACSQGYGIKKVIIIFIVVSLCVTLLRGTLMFLNQECWMYTHTRIDSLLFGFILAAIYNYWPDVFYSLQKKRILLFLGVLFCFIYVLSVERFSMFFGHLFDFLDSVFADLGSAGFILLTFRPVTNLDRGWLYRSIAFIGVYSYGIYLWHLASGLRVQSLAHYLPPHIAPWFFAIAPYPAGILCGIVMTKLIEIPFLKLRERLVPSPGGSHLLPDSSESAGLGKSVTNGLMKGTPQ